MVNREFPYEPGTVSDEVRRRLEYAFPLYNQVGLAPFGPTGCLMPSDAKPYLEQCYNTPVHSDDVWIVTLPKCGTTWTQEMVWLISKDLDYASAECLLSPDRYQFLEITAITERGVREEIRRGQNPVSQRLLFEPVHSRPRPWFIKTHLPLHMCPPELLDTAKVIYVARNPKDMCVSYFNHLKIFEERNPNMTMGEFVDMFTRGEVNQLPFFPHVLEAWKQRHHPNMLFLFFEDMKRDLRGCIRKMVDFLGKSFTEEQLDKLEAHLHFSNMKNNPWVNKNMGYAYSPLNAEQLKAKLADAKEGEGFMRKGETGDWKNHFSEKMNAEMNQWIEKELEGSDLRFDTESKRK